MVKKLVCVNNVLMIEVNLLCFKGLCLNFVDCTYPQHLTPCLPCYSRCSHFLFSPFYSLQNPFFHSRYLDPTFDLFCRVAIYTFGIEKFLYVFNKCLFEPVSRQVAQQGIHFCRHVSAFRDTPLIK